MNETSQRAMRLFQMQRYDLAEREARQAIAEEPGNALAHGILAECLMERDKLVEATDAAKNAIAANPTAGFPHVVLAKALLRRNRADEAVASVDAALEIDPFDVHALQVLASARFAQNRWNDALEAADRGLAIDPADDGCLNFRAMALTQLGRRDEAAATAKGSLANDPNNDFSQAVAGWNLLNEGKHQEAKEHFREALRLDPENEFARAGLVESIKSRSPLYRALLRFNLWMTRTTGQYQVALLVGAYFLYRALNNLAKSHPGINPYVRPLLVAYLLFAFWSWIGPPLSNLILRLDREGRHALSPDDRAASTWFGVFAATAIASVSIYFLGGPVFFLLVALTTAPLGLFTPVVFRCEKGWPRKMMAAYVVGLGALGTFITSCLFVAEMLEGVVPKDTALQSVAIGTKLIPTFFTAAVIGQFVAMGLMAARPKI